MKSKVKILDGHEQNIMKYYIPKICESNIFVTQWNACEIEELLQKEPNLIFAPNILGFFLDT